MGTTGFQFIHLEAYSRKADTAGRSVSWVLDEAARAPGACPHVSAPAAPEIVFGLPVEEVRRRHDEACAGAKAILANGKTRAISSGQKTMLTVVASHPASMNSVHADPGIAADVAAWEARTVAWLRAQYGDGLVSVVRHVDESRAHIHAYILPADLRATHLHPGTAAKRAIAIAGPGEGEDSKTLNRRGDAAYRQAMREWQDGYWEQVGLPSGLARLGPGRRRLSRSKWQAEKAAAAATRQALNRAAQINARGSEFAAKTMTDAAAVIAAAQEKAVAAQALHDTAEVREKQVAAIFSRADRQATEAKALHATAQARERKASETLSRAGRQAERIVAGAEARASLISSFGSRLRSLWDGLRRSSIMEAARRAVAADLSRERARADEAARRVLEEASRRQESERRARAAAEAARVSARERDQARQSLAAMRPAAPEAGRRMGR